MGEQCQLINPCVSACGPTGSSADAACKCDERFNQLSGLGLFLLSARLPTRCTGHKHDLVMQLSSGEDARHLDRSCGKVGLKPG